MSRTVVQGYVSGAPPLLTKVETFKASGTFTPPAGVTYAIAYIRGGGGGSTGSGAAGTGGTSSVAFASGTVTALGGLGVIQSGLGTSAGVSAPDNSGAGTHSEYIWAGGAYTQWGANNAHDGSYVVAGGAVTAGVGITVTVGSGGTGTQVGGSGLVYIEYLGY
jgi:hypothetical protein